MPGIIISNVFKEKFALTFQTTPRKVQLSGPTQTIEEVADLLGVDIRALDLPRIRRRGQVWTKDFRA